MKKLGNVFDILKPVGKAVNEHKGTILTVVNIAATCYAVYRAYKDGPKFKKVLEECKEEELGFVDTAKKVIPVAAPTVAAVAVSGLSAVGMNKEIGELKGALDGMTSAYDLMRIAKTEYEEKTEQVVGPEKAAEIRESIAKDHFDKAMDEKREGIKNVIVTGHGDDLFYDDWSGRFFTCDINFIKKAVNDLNYQLINDMFVGLNEFYAYIGLPENGAGRQMGWDVDYGTIELDVVPALDECDRAYTIIRFRKEPIDKFSNRRRW